MDFGPLERTKMSDRPSHNLRGLDLDWLAGSIKSASDSKRIGGWGGNR